MNRRLVLIRHAKTEGSNPGGDHERELVQRGHDDAGALGDWLREEGLEPGLVLVSTAVRARQTLEGLLAGDGAGDDVETWTSRSLYDGGVDGLLEAVSEADDAATTVWLVGHEPTISTAAWELLDKADRSVRAADDIANRLSHGIPTATAIVLEVDEPWSDLETGSARFVAIHSGRA